MVNTDIWSKLQTSKHIVVKYRVTIIFTLFLLACIPVFFLQLDKFTVRMWDEARPAVNALEMTLNGNWFVAYYDGKPDMEYTKPALLIWSIALAMKLFGYNEFALRLPSAISALSTTIIIFWFGKSYFNSLIAGLSSGLVLITSIGFVGEHVARTGDFDAMLVLWITVYSLSFFTYLHTRSSNRKSYLYIAAIAFVLAVLTKGIAGMIPLPGLFIYTIYQKKLGKLFSAPELYYLAVLSVASILSFYLLREYYNPGYLNIVVSYEILSHYTDVLETHSGPVTFYLWELKRKFIPWLYILPIGLIVSQISRNIKIKRFGMFGFFFIGCYLLIISFARTKVPWYDAPVYPIASIIVGLGVSEILESLLQNTPINGQFGQRMVVALMMAGLFFIPYVDTVYNKIYKQRGLIYEWSQDTNPQLLYGDYLKKLAKEMPELKNFSVIRNEDDYNAHLLFYVKVANLDRYFIKLKSSEELLEKNEVIITCDEMIGNNIEERYETTIVDTQSPCQTLEIKGLNPQL